MSKILASVDTVYGIGILNEPHICGYLSGNALFPACIDDFYPKGKHLVQNPNR